MHPPMLHHVSNKIGQAILGSSKIICRWNSLYFKLNCARRSGIFTRHYTIPSTPGSGVGKGGGAGGTVRESGGALGQYGAAHEEEFFYHKQREQLEKMKSKIKKEQPKSPEISQKKDK